MNIPFTNYELKWSSRQPTVKQTISDAQTLLKKKEDIDIELPVKGGRSTVPDSVGLLSILFNEFGTINPEFNVEYLKALEHLAMFNADLSLAVENVVSLGNTEFRIEFDDKVPAEMSKEMNALIRQKARKWYKNSEGLHSLVNDLLAQVSITGVVSAEIVPDNDLSGVKKVVIVSPKSIRFVRKEKDDEFKPFQVIKGQLDMENTTGLKELNEVTYKYIALRRINENPYGIPPFLAALESITIERDMICNMVNVIKKLGILGFLSVLVNKPAKKTTGETDAQYRQRMLEYLQEVAPQVDASMAKGYVVGFKDTHEFKMDGVLTNTAGAKDIVGMNDATKFAGLKMDPLMMGRNNSTTETLARVILVKTIAQTINFQKTVGAFLRELFLMELLLAGYRVTSLEVRFEKAMIGDKLKEEQARTIQIDNAVKLRNEGIINQQQVAEELGYEKPDQEEPPVKGPVLDPKTGHPAFPAFPAPDPLGGNGTSPDKASNIKDSINSYEVEFRIDAPEYEYNSAIACSCDEPHKHRFTQVQLAKDDLKRYELAYRTDTGDKYRAAIAKITGKIAKELTHLGEGASLEQVTDKIFYHLYKGWKTDFTEPQKKVIKKHIREAYVYFRRNKAPFGGKATVPDATFGVVDTRTMEYFASSDELYLGKFITDRDTRKALTEFIKEEYIAKNVPLGSTEGMDAFKAKFGDLLMGEEWKLDRIISTTVNKLRNYASVAYMSQAEVETFEIVGINDRLQCGYCSAMQGKQFSVTTALEKVESVTKSQPEIVKYDSPFITGLFKTPADMAGLSAAELQAKGIDTPPYHPGCRDIIVAVL